MTSNMVCNYQNINGVGGVTTNSNNILSTNPGGQSISGQYIVTPKEDVIDDPSASTKAIEILSTIAIKEGAQVIYHLNSTETVVIRMPPQIANQTNEILDKLRSNSVVAFVQQDTTVVAFSQTETMGIENCDGYPDHNGWQQIHLFP